MIEIQRDCVCVIVCDKGDNVEHGFLFSLDFFYYFDGLLVVVVGYFSIFLFFFFSNVKTSCQRCRIKINKLEETGGLMLNYWENKCTKGCDGNDWNHVKFGEIMPKIYHGKQLLLKNRTKFSNKENFDCHSTAISLDSFDHTLAARSFLAFAFRDKLNGNRLQCNEKQNRQFLKSNQSFSQMKMIENFTNEMNSSTNETPWTKKKK